MDSDQQTSKTPAMKAIADAKLFENLENVWKKVGRLPTYGEMKLPPSTIDVEVYSKRFGTWLRACEAFIKQRKGLQFKKPLNPAKSGRKSLE